MAATGQNSSNTARTILHLMATGRLRKYPRIKFVFCHGGGALTPLLARPEGFTGWFECGPERLAQLDLPQDTRAAIEHGNARRLLGL